MLFALSFVAPEDVHASFEELADNAPEVLTQLFQYWKDTYTSGANVAIIGRKLVSRLRYGM